MLVPYGFNNPGVTRKKMKVYKINRVKDIFFGREASIRHAHPSLLVSISLRMGNKSMQCDSHILNLHNFGKFRLFIHKNVGKY